MNLQNHRNYGLFVVLAAISMLAISGLSSVYADPNYNPGPNVQPGYSGPNGQSGYLGFNGQNGGNFQHHGRLHSGNFTQNMRFQHSGNFTRMGHFPPNGNFTHMGQFPPNGNFTRMGQFQHFGNYTQNMGYRHYGNFTSVNPPNPQNSSDTSQPSSAPIPSWVKTNAKFWSQGQLGDSDFVNGLQYLIQHGMIKVAKTTVNSTGSQQIPKWVHSSADLWISNQISDNDFLQSVQYLISSGIIHV